MADSIIALVEEIKKYKSICYYPSSGIDLSDIDFFGSGKLHWSERVEGAPLPVDFCVNEEEIPDLFIHTDINFYMQYEEGLDLEADECNIHGDYEILSFRELPQIKQPNKINDNYEFSGKCFEYKLKVWNHNKIITLIHILVENEYAVSQVFLKNGIKIGYMWSKDWAGSLTCGTWFANICDQLHTKKIYTDWLCVPGKRGQPLNKPVLEHYPELMVPCKVKLIKNENAGWIDESAHSWLSELDIRK